MSMSPSLRLRVKRLEQVRAATRHTGRAESLRLARERLSGVPTSERIEWAAGSTARMEEAAQRNPDGMAARILKARRRVEGLA